MTEAKSCGLKDVGNAGVEVGMVAGVGGEVVADEGRQVLVGNDVLQRGDVQTSGALEQILV